MTMVAVPVPQSPIGTIETDPVTGVGRIIVSREWYRFFGLIQTAVGGSTTTIQTILEQPFTVSPPANLQKVERAVEELRALIITQRGLQSQVDEVTRRIKSVEHSVYGTRGNDGMADTLRRLLNDVQAFAMGKRYGA